MLHFIATFDVLKANKITSNIESIRRLLRQGEIEGIALKKTLLRQAAEQRHYSPKLVKQVWERCVANSSAYKQPRINYLLDAFSFAGQRLKLDTDFASKEEQVIYAVFEYVKKHEYNK